MLIALRGLLTTSKEELSSIWSTGRDDYIWIDGQHSPFSEEELVNYCRVAEEQLRITVSQEDPPG